MKYLATAVFILHFLTICHSYEPWLNRNTYYDFSHTVPDLIHKYGYTCETHYVKTEDRYILQVHRIIRSPEMNKLDNEKYEIKFPNPKENAKLDDMESSNISEIYSYINNNFKKIERSEKKTVFLMHGLFSTSADWIVGGPQRSLAYLLADQKYDVWMGNSRGNRYSRNHTTLSPSSEKFWKFSFHEIGIYDVPATIDYILNITKQNKLAYIGISEGASAFFVMGSELPEYLNKTSHMHAIAPVTFLHESMDYKIKSFSMRYNLPWNHLFPYEIFQLNNRTQTLFWSTCNEYSPLKFLCKRFYFELYGEDNAQFNETTLAIILGHFPAGGSSMQISHIGQLVLDNRFGQYDYGTTMNILEYGKMSPPDYDLSNLNVSVAIYYSKNDAIANARGIQKLIDRLPKVVEVYQPSVAFNHGDFLLANDVKPLLNDKLMEVLEEYSEI